MAEIFVAVGGVGLGLVAGLALFRLGEMFGFRNGEFVGRRRGREEAPVLTQREREEWEG